MRDEYDIQRVLNLYSQKASIGEWDAVLALYLPDAVWEIPQLGLKRTGHDEIRATLTRFVEDWDYVLQLNSPAVIDVAGDTATAHFSIRECGKFKGRQAGFEFLGLYEDTLARTDAGWKFRKKWFKGIGTHFFPLLDQP